MSARLAQALTRYTNAQSGDSPFMTAIDGLMIMRANREKSPSHLIFKPALCLVAQGAKRTTFGGQQFDYRAGQALVVSLEMPAYGRVTEASAEKPYLGVVIEFDLAVMRDVMESLDSPPQTGSDMPPSVFVMEMDEALTDCALRVIRLLDTPKAIPMLYPSIMREMCYWLLTGPHGSDVARITLGNSHSQRVIGAIHALRTRFAETIRIEDLATAAQMSTSAFHRQFKALTSMTPLQYQKQMRLLEARHLMMTHAANVETAAFRIGYESASQFSREYARMFGAPPRRDVAALRAVAA